MPAHTTPRKDATFLFRKKEEKKTGIKLCSMSYGIPYMPTTAFHREYERSRPAKVKPTPFGYVSSIKGEYIGVVQYAVSCNNASNNLYNGLLF